MLWKIDQENLERKIQNWIAEKSQDLFFFRRCSLSHVEANPREETEKMTMLKLMWQKLLFAHQAARQRRLMSRYNNEITLLDATYKTMRYKLPLFFLVVKTNINFVVVGSFIIQNETTASIEEALNIFRTWNPTWSPSSSWQCSATKKSMP